MPSPLPRRARALLVGLAIATPLSCGGGDKAATGPSDAGLLPADAASTPVDGGSDAASPPPALAIDRAEDLGPQTMPSTIFGRDGGQSTRIGSSVLWTFGDTFLNTKAADGSTVRSSTAAWGDALDPRLITEPVDANGVPFQLIPYTATEAADNARDLQTGWALWAGAPIDNGAGGAVVLFSRVRRTKGGFQGEGTGIATLKPPSTVARRSGGDLSTAPELSYESGALVDGGFVYLYACGFHCKVARTPLAEVDARPSYRFYDGSTWQADAAKAADVIRDAGGLSVRWNAHLHRFLAVYIRFGSHALSLRTAQRPEGPWTEPTVVLDDPVAMPPAIGANQNSYLGLQRRPPRDARVQGRQPDGLPFRWRTKRRCLHERRAECPAGWCTSCPRSCVRRSPRTRRRSRRGRA